VSAQTRTVGSVMAQTSDVSLNLLRHSTPPVFDDRHLNGLYILRGTRRVGKSIEAKKTTATVDPQLQTERQIVHYSCDTAATDELCQRRTSGDRQDFQYAVSTPVIGGLWDGK